MIIINGEKFDNLKYNVEEKDDSLFISVNGVIRGVKEKDRFIKSTGNKVIKLDIPEEYFFGYTVCEYGYIQHIEAIEDENTEYEVNYVFEKASFPTPSSTELTATMIFENIKNRVNIMALKEFLIEANIMTKEDYQDKVNKIFKENEKRLQYEFLKKL